MIKCDFSTEQILEDQTYCELCNCFFNLAYDDEMKSLLKDILYEGGSEDFTIHSETYNRDNPGIERQRRISMAYLLVRNPETFYYLKDNNINLFHGTNADALVSILENGINSNSYSSEHGIEVKTGEEWSRINGGRDFISATDILDISAGYACLKKDTNELNFGVIFGINVDDVKDKLVRVLSDIPEAGIRDNIPIESISFIGVPSDRLEFVKKLVGDNIKVLPIDDMKYKFYYENEGFYTILYDKYEKFKDDLNRKNDKSFGEDELESISKTRNIMNIKNLFSRVSNLFSLDESDEELEHGRNIR